MRATGRWSVVAVVMGMGMGVGGCDPGAGDGGGEGAREGGGEGAREGGGEGANEGGGGGEGEDEGGCAVDADCPDGEVCALYFAISSNEGFCRPPAERGEYCDGFGGDGDGGVACVGDLLCERDPEAEYDPFSDGAKICVPPTNRANGEPCDTNDQCSSGDCHLGDQCISSTDRANGEPCDTNEQCSSGDCHLGDQCIPNECDADTDCDAGLVCKISSCDGAACVAPAGEGETCNAVDFRGCPVTHTCQDALTCTVDGLCD